MNFIERKEETESKNSQRTQTRSVDNSLTQPKISLYYGCIGRSATTVSNGKIDQIFKRIKSVKTQRKIELLNSYATPKHYISATFSALFSPVNKVKYLKTLSGLICISLINLPAERINALKEVLRYNPYTYLIFNTFDGNGLNIIVQILCRSVAEHEAHFYYLSEYYRKTYEITENEIDLSCKDICHLCYLPYDPDVHCNPESLCVSLPKENSVDTDSLIIPFESIIQKANSNNNHKKHTGILESNLNSVQTHQQNVDEQLETLLNSILKIEKQIEEAASHTIIRSHPLISRLDVPIINRSTINIVQGKHGQHKSRWAEMMVSLLLAKKECTTNFLGFEKSLESVMVCYLDTERNITEECASALQRIRQKAGYEIESKIPDFRFVSLKQEERDKRLEAIESFLKLVRNETQLHMFIVLDVVTDCINSFNDDRQAMRLFDIINNLCEQYNSTFLLIIHENPSSEKARGHVGTEAANKSSTVMQISIDKDRDNTVSELIRLRFLKLRGNKKPDDIYLQFSDITKGLVLANEELIVRNSVDYQRNKLSNIAASLGLLLAEGEKNYKAVSQCLQSEFEISPKTIQTTINGIIDGLVPIYNADGEQVKLARRKEGNKHFLFLETLV